MGKPERRETILSIEEVFDRKNDGITFSGFEIKTTEQTIKLLIANEQDCCEDWGYMMTNDTLEDFLGATIMSVDLVGTDEIDCGDGETNRTVFVNVVTDKGTLQFTAYNEHNGYYGHAVVVESNQLNYKETL